MVHIRQAISLFQIMMEFVLRVAESGCLLDEVPFLGALAVPVGPPLCHRFWWIHLSINSHWMAIWFWIVMIHIWDEIALLHFVVELGVAIAEASGFLHVIPFLGSLPVAMGPPL